MNLVIDYTIGMEYTKRVSFQKNSIAKFSIQYDFHKSKKPGDLLFWKNNLSKASTLKQRLIVYVKIQ